MSIDIVSVLLIIANVLVLYFVLNKLLYKPVAKFIGKREEAIVRARDQINRGKTAETDAKAHAEEILAQARAQAEKLSAQIQEEGRARADAMVAQAREQAEGIVQKAREQMESEREQMRRQVREEAVGSALALTSKMLKREVTRENNQDMIDEYLEKVG